MSHAQHHPRRSNTSSVSPRRRWHALCLACRERLLNCLFLVWIADGSASGLLLLNSNAMDVIVTEEAISFRIVGGILDFYFFAGPTPAAIMEQFTRLVGRPKLPPFWSLGFHQCK